MSATYYVRSERPDLSSWHLKSHDLTALFHELSQLTVSLQNSWHIAHFLAHPLVHCTKCLCIHRMHLFRAVQQSISQWTKTWILQQCLLLCGEKNEFINCLWKKMSDRSFFSIEKSSSWGPKKIMKQFWQERKAIGFVLKLTQTDCSALPLSSMVGSPIPLYSTALQQWQRGEGLGYPGTNWIQSVLWKYPLDKL